MLLESIKPYLTRQLVVDIDVRSVNEDLVKFLEKNVKKFPGRSTLKLNILEPKTNARISMYTLDNGFEMNDEMAAFLENRPDLDVQIVSS